MDHFSSPFPYAADVIVCSDTRLTQQERVILCLVLAGYSRKEMALKLFVSINTVKTHLQNIYRKLDVNSRSQAISRAHSLGLFPPSSRM
ncbi:MAG: response regulator transcription factor [Anaerolineae bacterium]|nr:response regulator transcription factor [Anaerolineae bacterium]